jgi:RNA polymerase sigma-70 factor (ECF subfamily)
MAMPPEAFTAGSALTDEQLLVALRSGDESAFCTLVGRYHRAMVHVAVSFVPSREVAEEVVQDTWMAVLRGVDRFEGRSSLKTWIFAVLENRARSSGARERRSTPFSSLEAVTEEEDSPTVDPTRFHTRDEPFAGYWTMPPVRWSDLPDERLLNAETRELVEAAIRALPVRQRQVVTLRDVEGWSSAEVRELLGLSDANQRVLLHRARGRVRAALERHLSEEAVT